MPQPSNSTKPHGAPIGALQGPASIQNILSLLAQKFKGSVQEAANDPENFVQNVAQGADPSFGFGAAEVFGRPDDPSMLLQFAAGMLTPGFGEFKAAGKGLRAILKHFREFPEASLAILKPQKFAVHDAIKAASPRELEEFINVLDSRMIDRPPGAPIDPLELNLWSFAKGQRIIRGQQKSGGVRPFDLQDVTDKTKALDEDLMDSQAIADIFGASPEQMLDVLQNPQVYGLTDDIAMATEIKLLEKALRGDKEALDAVNKLHGVIQLGDDAMASRLTRLKSDLSAMYDIDLSELDEALDVSLDEDLINPKLPNTDDIEDFASQFTDEPIDFTKGVDPDAGGFEIPEERFEELLDEGLTADEIFKRGPGADDFLPEGMTPEDFARLKANPDKYQFPSQIKKEFPHLENQDLIDLWNEIHADDIIDPTDLPSPEDMVPFEELFGEGNPPLEGDIPGISEPNIIDEIIKGGDEVAGVGNIPHAGGYVSIHDFNKAMNRLEGGEDILGVFAPLADDSDNLQRIMQDASVDELEGFIDNVYDAIDTGDLVGGNIRGVDARGVQKMIDEGLRGPLGNQSVNAPLELEMMVALTKHELLAKAILGENAVGGIEESLKAFNVFDEVLFPEIPSSTLRANLRQMFQSSQNEVEALKFMWNTSRGR
jgi:hypothetical protein